VLAQIRQPRLNQRTRRRRDEHLAAVADRGDPRRPMHVHAHVALLGQERRPRVHAHPRADRAGGEALTRFGRGGERTRSGEERVEECVSLRVHLDAAVGGERLPHQPSMLCQRRRVPLRPQLVQELRRPLHVREEKRHRPGRKIAHTPII
jgi:hypothetical protein